MYPGTNNVQNNSKISKNMEYETWVVGSKMAAILLFHTKDGCFLNLN
jgi:hypothetical protein